MAVKTLLKGRSKRVLCTSRALYSARNRTESRAAPTRLNLHNNLKVSSTLRRGAARWDWHGYSEQQVLIVHHYRNGARCWTPRAPGCAGRDGESRPCSRTWDCARSARHTKKRPRGVLGSDGGRFGGPRRISEARFYKFAIQDLQLEETEMNDG
jgi:hypothetical protein